MALIRIKINLFGIKCVKKVEKVGIKYVNEVEKVLCLKSGNVTCCEFQDISNKRVFVAMLYETAMVMWVPRT
jgi:hypothetical protein